MQLPSQHKVHVVFNVDACSVSGGQYLLNDMDTCNIENLETCIATLWVLRVRKCVFHLLTSRLLKITFVDVYSNGLNNGKIRI